MITAFCELRTPAEASARSSSAKDRPPRPSAPMRRKSRRVTSCAAPFRDRLIAFDDIFSPLTSRGSSIQCRHSAGRQSHPQRCIWRPMGRPEGKLYQTGPLASIAADGSADDNQWPSDPSEQNATHCSFLPRPTIVRAALPRNVSISLTFAPANGYTHHASAAVDSAECKQLGTGTFHPQVSALSAGSIFPHRRLFRC